MRVMIPVSGETVNWQDELSRSIRSLDQLLQATGNKATDITGLDFEGHDFPVRVPLPFVDRIEYGNPADPLLRQVLPLKAEQHQIPSYLADPLEEEQANPVTGIIHKYQGRVLLILAGACAINCRYCFRRHFNYQDNLNSLDEWKAALSYLQANPDINEVILSGGDPLLNSNERLDALIKAIAAIPNIKRLRIHSRMPIVIPQRIDNALVHLLTQSGLQVVMVLHANHPNEINQQVALSLQPLRQAGIMLFNQAVLLKGVNDHADTLSRLSETLFAVGVLPYYLHCLDKVQGAAHFDLPIAQAKMLAGELSARLPGYLVPKLVREQAGASSKTLILPRY